MARELKFFIDEWRRERPDVDLTAFVIATAIRQIDQQTEAEFRRVSARLGIGPGDLRVLFALRRSGVNHPRRPTDLFQSLLVTSGAISKQVARLVSEGLAERLADPSYQRGSLIRLTRRGVKVADSAIAAVCSDQTSIGAAISSLSAGDQEQGPAFLQTLLTKFDATDRSDEPATANPPARKKQSTNAKPSSGSAASVRRTTRTQMETPSPQPSPASGRGGR